MKILILVMAGITLAGSLTLYESRGDKIRMYSDPKAMKKEILKNVPLGSRIEDAKRKMEKSGFGCTMMHNEEFSVQKDNPPEDDPHMSTLHGKADFLLCEKQKQTWPMVSQEWSIIIVHKDGIVSEVFVNVGITGP